MPYGKILVDELENSNGTIVDLDNLTSSDATTSASGYMSAADKTKLDGIEAGATADQTGAEIKAAYEGEADTNAFTDAEQTKLAGVEAGATADQTGAEIKAAYEAEADTNAFTDAEQTKLAGIAAGAEANVATDLTYTASTRELASSTGTNATLPEVVAAGDSGLMTGADKTKLDAIEAGATADQTGSEIKAAYEGEADTNAYTDAAVSKLAGIEINATADQTGAEIKAAYEAEADTNAFTDAEKTKLSGIEAGAEVNTVDSVAGKTGAVTLAKGDVGLGNVDNTSDANKPVSTAQQTALDGKADLVGGVLDSSQLPDIAVSEYKGAVADQTAMLAISGEKGDWVIRNDDSKVYVITGTNPASASDWTALSYPAGFSGAYADLTGKPTLGTAAATDSTAYATAAQGSTADSAVQPGDLATVATTGAYGDLSGTPTIPTNNNQLTNGAGYVTSSGNTIIGTDSDINTSGATVVDQLNMTDGVITSHSTRTMTLADLGYTGATNANYITNNNQLTNGAGYTTHPNPAITSNGSTPSLNSGITGAEVRSLIGAGTSSFSGSYNDLSNKPTIPTNNNQLTNGAGYITSANGGNAATLDGIDSSQFLRSDASDQKTSGTLRFNDYVTLSMGSSDDAQFFCSGSDLYLMLGSALGNFYIRDGNTDKFFFQKSTGNFSAVGNVTAYSDIRLKSDIEPITNALEKVEQINGVTYTRIDSGERQTGLIAQEVEKVMPEAVMDGEEYKSVAYGNLVGLLVEAVKELKEEVKGLKAEVATLKQERN